MKILTGVLAALFLCPLPAKADNWVFEFELNYWLDGAHLTAPWCRSAVIINPPWPKNPRGNGTTACGGGPVLYNHFLGRKCFNGANRIKKLTFYCGWRHRSAPFETVELNYDALGFKGRFEF